MLALPELMVNIEYEGTAWTTYIAVKLQQQATRNCLKSTHRCTLSASLEGYPRSLSSAHKTDDPDLSKRFESAVVAQQHNVLELEGRPPLQVCNCKRAHLSAMLGESSSSPRPPSRWVVRAPFGTTSRHSIQHLRTEDRNLEQLGH